jgi:hypothetical protein
MRWFLLGLAAVAVFGTTARADDKKPAGPVALKLVAKTDKYKFDGGGKAPADYKKELEGLAKKAAAGELVQPPAPPTVDLLLVFTNTSKEDVTIYVGGDANTYTFELTGGAGTVAVPSGRAFTAEFRLPKAVTLAPGKTHEIEVAQLSDGLRGAARNVYWTGPGEYKLSATYTLTDKDGEKGPELKSEPVRITVEK